MLGNVSRAAVGCTWVSRIAGYIEGIPKFDTPGIVIAGPEPVAQSSVETEFVMGAGILAHLQRWRDCAHQLCGTAWDRCKERSAKPTD
jgi:hypothetical protein